MIFVRKKVRLISASYSKINDGVVIELFGKTIENESITMLFEGFRPYFHLVDPPSELITELKNTEGIRHIEDIDLWVDGAYRPCKKIVCTYPWKVPGYRNKSKKYCKVLAADIPFVQRFIFDKDLISSVYAFGNEVQSEKYSTDIVMKVEKFEDSEPFKPNLKILSFDIENSISDETIYTICCVVDNGINKKKKCFHGDERDILKELEIYIQKEDPDVVSGYNIKGYDLPLLDKRVKELSMEGLKLGRDRSELKKISDRNWDITGRIIADAWWSVRKEMKLKRETLNHVAKELLDEEKKDVDPSKIDREWKENNQKVMEYCLKDADLALRIIKELDSLDKAMDMATVSKLPVDEGLNGRTSVLVDSILIREADKNKIGVPLTNYGHKRSKIKGGYVHSVEPGLYHWVSVLDFKSMYPSVMMENNICFTTISENGDIKSPTGVRFLSKQQKGGILPKILRELMKERDEVKKKMESADGKEKEYYDGLQSAIKILMNSFYGVFASSFYRFTDKRIGESITSFARKNIKNLIDELQNDDLKVIYSDTDSVFFQSPKRNLEDTIKISKEIATDYSKGAIILEFEKVLNPFFTHGKKKRYVGKVIWPEEDILVRGYELRRSDSFEAQNQSLENVFERILDDDIEGAITIAKKQIEKTRNGEVELEKLVISRTCKNHDFYKNPESMPNVQASRKMEKLGYKFTPGMKVSWIVVDSKKTPQKVEPWLPDKNLEEEPDWEYYARRIAKTLARVTEVFGWDEESLMIGKKQSDLFSDKFKNKRKENKKQKFTDKKEKNTSLEDFL